MDQKPLKIAVIGSGVAGLTAAYLLNKKHQVTLYEKNNYLGGHTNTLVIEEGPDAGTPVDTGFIVFNHRNYPLFTKLLSELDVQAADSDMSFSFSREKDHFAYSSYVPRGLFACRRNFFNPFFFRMITDILKFNRSAAEDLRTGKLRNISLGDYLKAGGYGKGFMHHYLIPTGAAIWSTPFEEMFNFPAESFIQFFDNHGLLSLKNRPQWKYIFGGSQTYVRKIVKDFRGEIFYNAPVTSIRRTEAFVSVSEHSGMEKHYDYVVIAAHADEALKMLTDSSAREKKLLGTWSYSKNHAILHTDPSAMPRNRKAWASWNYIEETPRDPNAPVSLTYYMNILQRLKTRENYFVTLNRRKPVLKNHIIKEISYTHPTYNSASVKTQADLPGLNGLNRTFYCGSYFGYGFHEDAVRSSVDVARHFGIEL
ncbi:MAG: FAD-dependent oxidoreductase [Candidatus Omnitrophica bacterium]|nr:FAD-dependent oxidoreductase [Candidatus Omnitrophota bacterium]